MTYTIKRCPHCGKEYSRYSSVTKNERNFYGSPFKECVFCSKIFVDKDMKELALKDFSLWGVKVINCILIPLWPYGMCSILPFIFYFSDDFDHSIIALLIGLGLLGLYLFNVIRYLLHREEAVLLLKEEYRLSEMRLQNHDYAMALQKIGYKVPERFLSTNRVNEENKNENNTL